jgi:hypothetical protein
VAGQNFDKGKNMPYFQDTQGGLHFLSDADIFNGQVSLLPSDCIEITDAQADQIQNPPITLAQARAAQLTILTANFAAASVANVTDSNGAIWSGGLQSALSIDGAARLAGAGGATTIEIFDASNAGHVLTIVQANIVSAAIGAAYQSVFVKYQGYKAAVAAATTVAEVQAITWS